MPINGNSLGKDLSYSIVTPSGTLSISGVTDYSVKPMNTNLTRKGLDGISDHATIPDGWEVSIKLDRRNARLHDFFVALEAAYFAGQNISNGTLSENVQESDGSVSKYQYTNVSLSFDNAGDFKGDAYVNQSITCRASRKIKL